jgi:hypothetical protein
VTALLAGRWFYFMPHHPWNYLVFNDKEAGLLLAFINWDGQHYLRLALGGYAVPADPSTAFAPLLPGLIALVMLAGLGPIAAGLVVVTACSAAVVLLLERLVPQHERGPSSLWLFACFPSAFYLSVVYSEALFLAALLGLFWSLRDPRRAGYAALCALLLPLARVQGLWLAAPLAIAWIFGASDRRSLAAATGGYVAGAALYFAFYAWRYGDPFAAFAVQKLFVSENAIANLLDLGRFVDFLLLPPVRFLATTNSGLDKLMILVSLAALALGLRHVRDPFVATAWICFAVLPAMMGHGSSYARYALIAWACFAVAVGPVLRPWAKWALIVPMFGLQTYLAGCFGGNRWVG